MAEFLPNPAPALLPHLQAMSPGGTPLSARRPMPRHLFIVGLHRSGTTMLSRLLGEQRQVSAFSDTGVMMDEGQHLQSVIPPSYDEPGWYSFHPNAHHTERSPLATPENRKTLSREWGKHWDRSKPVLLEKSPGNLFRTRLLQRFFSDSAFIFLRRHPVAQALAMEKWNNPPPKELCLWNWARSYEMAARDNRHLRRSLWLSYEDLTADLEKTLAQLSRFLGFQVGTPTFDVRKDVNERYFDEWRTAQPTSFSQRAAARLLEPRIVPFGYSFNDLKR